MSLLGGIALHFSVCQGFKRGGLAVDFVHRHNRNPSSLFTWVFPSAATNAGCEWGTKAHKNKRQFPNKSLQRFDLIISAIDQHGYFANHQENLFAVGFVWLSTANLQYWKVTSIQWPISWRYGDVLPIRANNFETDFLGVLFIFWISENGILARE